MTTIRPPARRVAAARSGFDRQHRSSTCSSGRLLSKRPVDGVSGDAEPPRGFADISGGFGIHHKDASALDIVQRPGLDVRRSNGHALSIGFGDAAIGCREREARQYISKLAYVSGPGPGGELCDCRRRDLAIRIDSVEQMSNNGIKVVAIAESR